MPTWHARKSHAVKTFLLAFLFAAAEAVAGCAGPNPNPAAAVATPSPTPAEDLTLYKTSELLTSLEFYNQQVKAALVHGDNASAQQWALKRGYLLDELRKRNVSPPEETSQPPKTTQQPKPVNRYRSHRARRPSASPTPSGLPGGRP
jgi:hypothetical protein